MTAPKGPITIAIFVFVTLACRLSVADDDFEDEEELNETVLSCEEAFARLEECCPDFDPGSEGSHWPSRCIDLRYQRTIEGCSSPNEVQRGQAKPALLLAESQCVRDTSCRDLVDSGVCERAKGVKARGEWSEDGRTHMEHDGRTVCP